MHAFPLFRLLSALLALCGSAQAAVLNATFHSATTVPLAQLGSFNANGTTVNFTLNFAPPVGTDLTLVRLTSFSSATTGSFTNLPHGQAVTMIHNGQPYDFVVNYYGGTGNDIVLEWASTRPMAWGNNGNGQLGTNSTTQSNLPAGVVTTGVLAGKTIISLSAGRNHSLALCSDGTVAAWGLNANGQIGSNGGSQSTVPVLVSDLGVLATKRVIALAAGETHSLALCSDGTIAAWGSNANGQLGRSGGSTATPVAVSTSGVLSGKRVVAIAAGQRHSVALLSTGEVATWGYNFYGQLGDGGNDSKTVPVLVSTAGVLTGKSVAVIAAGSDHCLAICSDGTLASWGDNRDGQLGDGTTMGSNVPVLVTTAGTFLAPRTVTAIAAGASHSLALCSDGRIASWGRNSFGQLGRTSGSTLLPGGVSNSGALSGKTVTSVAGGSSHSLALCSDGTLTAWGSNSFGEMGTGNTTPSNVPQNVSTTPLFAGQRFHAVAMGPNAFHSLAIVASLPQPNELTAGTLISNGSFENGFSDWSVSDLQSPFENLQVRNNGYQPGFDLFSTLATDGSRSASSGFDGYGPGIVRLAHDVLVTATEPFVRFDYRAGWDMLGSNGSTKARTFSVTIEPAGGGPVLQKIVILTAAPQTKTLDTGPLVGSVDLSAYVGTLVRVCFDLIVPEVNTGPAFFQLDNVRTAALLPASINPITKAATNITTDAATLNGIVNTNGLEATVEFEYGLTPSYGSLVTATPSPLTCTTDTFVSAAIAGLNKNTTYHYRIKTTTSEGVKVGANKSFTTLPHAPILNGLSSTTE
jgi:alpha-tubulin suppressor-like RCC1 family protein